jgi:peptidoglycan/LPS O-acetylase OafA/YrhL
VVARKFFWARIARVYPVYVACLLLDLPHFVHSKHLDVLAGDPQQHAGVAATLGVNLLLLQGWFTHFMGINGPGWSLSNEAFFYALFPLVAAPLCRLRMRQAMAAMAAVYVAGNLAVVGFGYLHPDPATWRYFPALHWFEFLIGILSARLHVCWSQSERGRVRLRQAAPWMLAGSFAAFAAAVPMQQLVSLQLLAHGVFTPLFCCAVLALAAGNRWLEMLFAPAWFCLLGEASYSLYLLHVPVFFLLRSRLAAHGNLFPLYCLLCIGLSVASYLWLEKPCRRWILKFARQRGLESEAAAAIAQ